MSAASSSSRRASCSSSSSSGRCSGAGMAFTVHRAPMRQQRLRCAAVAASSRASASFGARLPTRAHNGSLRRWRMMGRWLESRAEIDVPVPLEVCWALWDDRARIPQWMPWIKSVAVQPDAPALSRWTLATHQFGRDWEFSWLARNLAPVRHQKIHWVSEPGTATLGLNVSNRGQIRFVRRPPGGCGVSLSISYEVPEALAPFANALTPVVEGVISQDMRRFKDYAEAYHRAQQAAPPGSSGGGSGAGGGGAGGGAAGAAAAGAATAAGAAAAPAAGQQQ